jgi:hypothetical protein
MSFILNRVQVGQQGVVPGELLMQSTDDLATITSPGYLTTADGILPSDIITCAYGHDFQLKQVFNPVFSGTEITLSIIGGGGSINGAVNTGAGDGLLGVSGSNITGKSLVAGANITLTPSGTDITIAATGSGGGTITGIADVGTGEGHISAGTAGSNVQVKTLHAGSNVVITEDSSSITIASTAANNGLTTLSNLPGGEGIYASTVGTVAQLKSIAAGAGIDISASADTVIITNVGGGGGGNFIYENTYWLAKNGNDTNDGLSINTPKLTLLAIEGLLTTTPTVINIVDDGVYPLPSTFTVSCPLLINAPGATIQWTGAASGQMFYQNTFSPLIAFIGNIIANNVNIFTGFSSCIVTVTNIQGTPLRVWDDRYVFAPDGVPQAIFNIGSAADGSFKFGFSGEQVINCSNLGTGQISSGLTGSQQAVEINAYEFGGLLSGAASYSVNVTNLLNTFNFTSSGSLNLNVANSQIDVTTLPAFNGFAAYNPASALFPVNVFNNDICLYNKSIVGETYNQIYTTPSTGSWSYTAGTQFGNVQLVVTNPNGTITLPQNAGLIPGWRMTVIQVCSSGPIIQVYPGSNDTLWGQGGFSGRTSGYLGQGRAEFIVGPSNGSGGIAWAAVNCFTSNLLNQVNIFISQVNGNDSFADGTLDNQFATIGAAKAYLIATYTANPTHGINLVITDDATYDENVDFTGTTNINFIGREAQVIYTGTGDAFTADSTMLIALAGINATGGGNAIVYNGGPSNALVANVDSVNNGNIVAGATGLILLQSFALLTGISSPAGGQIKYSTIFRSGVDGLGVVGISTDSASANWTVGGTLSASGLTYPTTDAAYGSVVTTNGSGVLSLQPAPTPFYFSSNPVAFASATITLDATFLGYRIIENNATGPCTWTMDTGINLTAGLPAAVTGSSFTVYVSNATGATITLVSSAGATVHGVANSQTNFTISLKYTASNTWDIFY